MWKTGRSRLLITKIYLWINCAKHMDRKKAIYGNIQHVDNMDKRIQQEFCLKIKENLKLGYDFTQEIKKISTSYQHFVDNSCG